MARPCGTGVGQAEVGDFSFHERLRENQRDDLPGRCGGCIHAHEIAEKAGVVNTIVNSLQQHGSSAARGSVNSGVPGCRARKGPRTRGLAKACGVRLGEQVAIAGQVCQSEVLARLCHPRPVAAKCRTQPLRVGIRQGAEFDTESGTLRIGTQGMP
jgi:hypothetical protein